MRYRQTIQAVARRLPFMSQRQVEEVVEVLTELWRDELVQGGSVAIPGIGRLSLEIQQMKRGGAMKTRGCSLALRRVYGRFCPATALRERLEEKTNG